MKKILIFTCAVFLLSACNIGRYTFIDSSKAEEVALGKFFDVEESFLVEGVPLGLVTSDNLALGKQIAQSYLGISESLQPTVVVLLAQDSSLDNEILTCKKCIYHTGFGDVNTEKDLGNKMVKNTSVKNSGEYFSKEKSIANQTIFVKKIFPDTYILPISVGLNVPQADLDLLAEWLNDNLSLDSLIVFTTHFSSGVQTEVADFHDSSTLSTLNNFEYENLKNLSFDSADAAHLFLKVMEKRGFQKMQNLYRSNSAMSFNEHVEYVDSYHYLAFVRGLLEPLTGVSILSFGNLPKDHDLEFGVGHLYDRAYDPISDITSYKFLKDIRGENDGFLRGVDFLVYDLVSDDCRVDKKGDLEIAFCKFNQASDEKEMLDKIKTMDVDLVYVMYEFSDGEVNKNIAKKIISSGADVVVGRGITEVVPFEKYKGGLIFYSLGDFITDSKLFSGDSDVSSGTVLGLYITPDSYDVYAFPVEVINGYPKIIDFSFRMQKFLHFISSLSTGAGDMFTGMMSLVKLSR